MATLRSEWTTEIQIRFVDLDAYSHVNNSVYLSYMEAARLPLVKDIFFEHMKQNIQYLLVKSEVNYIRPILYDDKLLVHCWFAGMSGAKFIVGYHTHNGEGKTFSTGTTVHALFDANKQKPMRIPEDWKNYVKEGYDEKGSSKTKNK